MRILIVTTDLAKVDETDGDRPHYEAALARAGVDFEHACWDDERVDWSSADGVVLRSPWDYPERLDDFLAWLSRIEPVARLHNPAAVVRWNLDKHYLAELAARGVPVIPTEFAETEAALSAALAAFEARAGDGELVIKPTISAGSRDTGRFAADEAGRAQAEALARRILAAGRCVMIQPFARSVGARGETALVLFDGSFSHAFLKGPILARGGGFLHGTYREDIEPTEPSSIERAVADTAAEAVHAIVRERFGRADPLLYARFDLVELDDGTTALLEAELFEPCFFLATDAGAADRFAAAVVRRFDGAG